MRLYEDLARFWDLITPLEDHAEEAELILALLQSVAQPLNTLLELGSGSGAIAHFLPPSIQATLVDRSPQMLEISHARNPSQSHVCSDILTLDLNTRFDAVLMHDAVMYLQSESELIRALEVACAHCRPGGAILFIPDLVREDFHSGHTLVGGGDTPEESARLTEWHWDPNPNDDQFQVEFSLLLRTGSTVECIHESHTMSFFSRTRWEAIFSQANLTPIAIDLAAGFPIGTPFLARR